MPHTLLTPLQQSPAQPQPGQRGDAARKRSGKFRAQPETYPAGFFSEPTRAWPAMRFESRLCNPHDSLYVGRPLDKARKPQQHQRPDPSPRRVTPRESCWIKRNTQPWAMWCLLVRRGAPMSGGEIAVHLGWRGAAVSGNAARLVDAGVLVANKLSRSLVQYSLGSTPVVER